jgi:hypothetical protein
MERNVEADGRGDGHVMTNLLSISLTASVAL